MFNSILFLTGGDISMVASWMAYPIGWEEALHWGLWYGGLLITEISEFELRGGGFPG